MDADGDYAKGTYKNGTLSSAEEGTWEIDGEKVVLNKDRNMGISFVFSYKGGPLVNNKHDIYKGNLLKKQGDITSRFFLSENCASLCKTSMLYSRGLSSDAERSSDLF